MKKSKESKINNHEKCRRNSHHFHLSLFHQLFLEYEDVYYQIYDCYLSAKLLINSYRGSN